MEGKKGKNSMNGLSKLMICLVFFSLFSINVLGDSALALKEIKSIEIPFNFTKSLPANTNISFIFNMNSTNFPDGLDYIVTANLRMTLDKKLGSSQSFNAIVNETHCSNSPYTTMSNSAQYVVNMLCINAINTTALNTTYNLIFFTDKDLDNLLLTIYLTYVNNPDFSELSDHINFTREIPLMTWNNTTIIKTTNISSFSLGEIANSIWNFTIRNVNLTATALNDLASSVWNFGGTNPDLRNTTTTNITATNVTANLTNKDIIKIVALFCEITKLCRD